jgi:hypothetical protein
MKPKDIFSLAVRLLGLLFLYFGLKAVSPLLDLETIESADKSDLVNAVLPIAFNLLVAWWLIGGGLLIRRAYPELPKVSDNSHSQEERGMPVTSSTRSQGLTDMDKAEKKLASLLEKPKDGRAA